MMSWFVKAVLPLALLLCWSGTASAGKFIVTVKGLKGEDDYVTDAEIVVTLGTGVPANKGEVRYDAAKKVYIVEIDESLLAAAGLNTVTLEVKAPKRSTTRLELLLGKEDQVLAVALPVMSVVTTQSQLCWQQVGTQLYSYPCNQPPSPPPCSVPCPPPPCQPPPCPPSRRLFHRR